MVSRLRPGCAGRGPDSRPCRDAPELPPGGRRGVTPDIVIPDGYRAAVQRAAFIARSSRSFHQVVGRSPERMLTGILSGAMPPAFESGASVRRGRMPCSAILTPKGKLLTDLRVARLGEGEGGALLLDIPEAGTDAALDHLRRYIPPRLARVIPPEEPLGILTVVGPGAAELLATPDVTAPGATLPNLAALESTSEGDLWLLESESSPGRTSLGLRIVRSGTVTPPAFDLIAAEGTLEALAGRLRERGVPEGDALVWETLRLEKGRPAYGVEMDEDTLPPEAGIQARCIDFSKGCFTGQEVIVRIRDRGHVNRRLCGFLLGEAPPPASRVPLFGIEGGQPVGELRSSIRSHSFGQTIGLGYVRRGVEAPITLRLGSPEGPAVEVRSLDDAGWVLVAGDSSFYP
ncbi:MAG: hypothetical protein EXR92_04815 [Gemmatimonadetes bacterium]|nr:hypothetical protein [Gemmatimonadota bacterium]